MFLRMEPWLPCFNFMIIRLQFTMDVSTIDCSGNYRLHHGTECVIMVHTEARVYLEH